MERVINFIAKHWYYTVIFTMYGAVVFYIGGINNAGWVTMAGADNNLALGIFVIVVRLAAMIFICTRGAFLAFELMYPEPGRYDRYDIWYHLVNFVLLTYITELAIIDILLHGI